MILKKEKEENKEKYNGFWRKLFIFEVWLVLFLIVAGPVIFIIINSGNGGGGLHCSSAVNCTDNGDGTQQCDYYKEDGTMTEGQPIKCELKSDLNEVSK